MTPNQPSTLLEHLKELRKLCATLGAISAQHPTYSAELMTAARVVGDVITRMEKNNANEQ